MSAQFNYLELIQHPYKPGFERFTYKFKNQETSEEIDYNIRISDTLIGQWDLEEIDVLKKAMFVYIVHKFLKEGPAEDIELNAYQTSSPNQFPYKSELETTTFPPTESVTV